MPYRISFVGAGNVAWHMAQALVSSGCTVSQIWSRHNTNAARLAQNVGATAINDLRLLSTADIDAIIIAVSDNAIGTVASQISADNTLLIHTAGSIGIEALSVAGRRYGVAWPVQSLVKDMAIDMSNVPFCIEGCDNDTTAAITALIQHISPHIYTLNGQQRRLAHLAACIVSNFGNALNALSQDLMKHGNIDFDILKPLILQNAQKTKHGNLWQQQTGPAARHDTKTIEAHRALIDDEEIRQFYELMTKIIEKHCSPSC